VCRACLPDPPSTGFVFPYTGRRFSRAKSPQLLFLISLANPPEPHCTCAIFRGVGGFVRVAELSKSLPPVLLFHGCSVGAVSSSPCLSQRLNRSSHPSSSASCRSCVQNCSHTHRIRPTRLPFN